MPGTPGVRYYLDMLKMKFGPYQKTFNSLSKDGGRTAAFPGPGTTNYLTHEDVSAMLSQAAVKQRSGEIW